MRKDPQQPLPRMGLALLSLFSWLLLSRCQLAEAFSSFTLKDVTLTVEPSPDVERDTNVTLRCHASVSSSGQQTLSRVYTFYKDGTVIYEKTTSTLDDFLYPITHSRAYSSGKYKCKVDIENRSKTSETVKLTVKGVSTPEFELKKGVLSEGEEVSAKCIAPEETGSFIFYFYKNSKEIQEERSKTNEAEVKLLFKTVGTHRLHCSYAVMITPDSIKSKASNSVTVEVKELSIAVSLEISPKDQIFEGDQLNIFCIIHGFVANSAHVSLTLSQGTHLLNVGKHRVNHSMVAKAENSGMFECILEMGNVVKVANTSVEVTELFSAPTLDLFPKELFQGDNMRLVCKSASFASKRIQRENVTYSIEPYMRQVAGGVPGVFSGSAHSFDLNYTCAAEARGIVKYSKVLPVRPKVSASVPKIWTVGRVVIGRPFQIRCVSERGSPPINYTLWWNQNNVMVNMTTVRLPQQHAVFTATVNKPEDISKFFCEAKNNPSQKYDHLSKNLNASVIVPLSKPVLTVLPDLGNVAEGVTLYLICGTNGTPPVTFKWYREDSALPLHTVTTNGITKDHQISSISRDHSGTYHCEAINNASTLVRSQRVTINVHMALWKKGLIGASCLLLVAVLVLLLVLRFRAKRVKVGREVTSVWSERPPHSGSDEEISIAANEPDVEYTEVVHPQPADTGRVPLRRGTDTVYSELQNSPHGAADHHEYGSVEYADLNGEQPDGNHTQPDTGLHHELPAVD